VNILRINAKTQRRKALRCGAILLEVVLALVLLAFAASVIGGGLHTAISSVERLKLNAHAADLAVSVISELQLGTKSLGQEGPQRFDWPFEFWTWEAFASSGDEPGKDTGRTRKVEVVIRYDDPPITHRLAQVIRLPEIKEELP
jgi:type II secretory pathway pseudopilin PulG